MAAPRTDAPAPSALVDDSPAAVVDAEVESKVGEEPAIVVDHLTFAYDKTKPVLRDVSLRVPAGARLLLVGDNGAGMLERRCPSRRSANEECGGADGAWKHARWKGDVRVGDARSGQ